MASDKAQYIVALIAEFAAHHRLTTVRQHNIWAVTRHLNYTIDSMVICIRSRLLLTSVTFQPIAAEWEVRYDYTLPWFQHFH